MLSRPGPWADAARLNSAVAPRLVEQYDFGRRIDRGHRGRLNRARCHVERLAECVWHHYASPYPVIWWLLVSKEFYRLDIIPMLKRRNAVVFGQVQPYGYATHRLSAIVANDVVAARKQGK